MPRLPPPSCPRPASGGRFLGPAIERGEPDEPRRAEQVRGADVRRPVVALIDPARSHESDEAQEPSDDGAPRGRGADERVREIREEPVRADIRDDVAAREARTTERRG